MAYPTSLTDQDGADVMRQQLLQRMLQANSQGYASLQPQVAMQGQANAGADMVPPPSMDTPTYTPRDQAQAQGAVQAMQGPPALPVSAPAVTPSMGAPAPMPAGPPMPATNLPPDVTPLPAAPLYGQQAPGSPEATASLNNMGALQQLRAQWQQNIQNNPDQAMAIYRDLAAKGFSPDQARQLLGGGTPDQGLMDALAQQGSMTVRPVQQLPPGQMQMALQHQNDIFAQRGVTGLDPMAAAGAPPWPRNLQEAELYYRDPAAFSAMHLGGGMAQTKDMVDQQLKTATDVYGRMSQSPAAQFIRQDFADAGNNYHAANMASQLNNQVFAGRMTPEQANSAWQQYLQANPAIAKSAQLNGTQGPMGQLSPRTTSSPSILNPAVRAMNPAMANMDPNNQAPQGMVDVGSAQSPEDPANMSAQPLPEPGQDVAPPPPVPRSTVSQTGKQLPGRYTTPEGEVFVKQLQRMDGFTPQQRALVTKMLQQGVPAETLLAKYPWMKAAADKAYAASTRK